MPLYLISHCVPLNDSQRDKIAWGITKIHTELFNAPSLFVNVRFSPADQHIGYVGGKRSQNNSISAHVRHGPSRTAEMYDKLTKRIYDLWGDAVAEDKDVRIFVLGDIVAGFEHGFTIPAAGKDKEWLQENYSAFQKEAEGGNQEMIDLVQEIKDRDLLS